MMIVQFFSDSLYICICCRYSFELHGQVKKYTACNLKTTELLDCVLIGVCAVIRLNTVIELITYLHKYWDILSTDHISPKI